jgi:hypothetical protein
VIGSRDPTRLSHQVDQAAARQRHARPAAAVG